MHACAILGLTVSDFLCGIPYMENVIAEFFVQLGPSLQLIEVCTASRTSKLASEGCRQELSRREVLSRTLFLWGRSKHWDLLFRPANSMAWKLGQWNALPAMAEGRTDVACAMIANFIYVCGGLRRGRATNSFERLSLERGVWETLPPLLGRRRVDTGAIVSVMTGHLYICGGLEFDGSGASSCVDRFYPDCNYWETLEDMPVRRCHAASIVFENQLYICGGSEDGKTPLNSVLRFDPAGPSWKWLPQMLERRCCASAVAANGNIYVGQCDLRAFNGGHDSPNLLTSGERLNMQSRLWSRCAPGLLCSPGASVAAVFANSLYICGGSSAGRPMWDQAARVVGTEREDQPPTRGARILRRNATT